MGGISTRYPLILCDVLINSFYCSKFIPNYFV